MKLNGISQIKKEYLGLFNKKSPKYPCCIKKRNLTGLKARV